MHSSLSTLALRRWAVRYWIRTPLGALVDVGEVEVQARTLRGALRRAQGLRRAASWNVEISEVIA